MQESSVLGDFSANLNLTLAIMLPCWGSCRLTILWTESMDKSQATNYTQVDTGNNNDKKGVQGT